MAQTKIKTESKSIAWNANLRPRVGMTVTYQGSEWSNTNGKNSIPGTDASWKELSSSSSVDSSSWKVIDPVSETNQAAFDSVDSALEKARGTEVLEWSAAVNSSDATQIDFGNIIGQIKSSSGYKSVDLPPQTVQGTNLSEPSTWFYVRFSDLTIQQQNTMPTFIERRQKMFIARFASNGSVFFNFESEINPAGQYTNQIRDVVYFLKKNGIPLREGFGITGNNDGTFNRAAGYSLELGAGSEDARNTPFLSARNPTGYFLINSLDPSPVTEETNVSAINTQYESSPGVLTNFTNGRFGVFPVHLFATGNITLQRSQFQYATKEDAENDIANYGDVYNYSDVSDNGDLLGWWIIQEGESDLTDTNIAKFVTYTVGSSASGGGGGASVGFGDLTGLPQDNTALAAEFETKEDKQKLETVISTGGNYNGLANDRDIYIFDHSDVQAVLSGIVAPTYNKRIQIRVTNSESVRIISENSSVTPANQILMPTDNPPPFKNSSVIELQYSFTYNRWVYLNSKGSGYMPSLAGSDSTIVEVDQLGALYRGTSKDLFNTNAVKTTLYTSDATLNTDYPDAIKGEFVFCPQTLQVSQKLENGGTGKWLKGFVDKYDSGILACTLVSGVTTGSLTARILGDNLIVRGSFTVDAGVDDTNAIKVFDFPTEVASVVANRYVVVSKEATSNEVYVASWAQASSAVYVNVTAGDSYNCYFQTPLKDVL